MVCSLQEGGGFETLGAAGGAGLQEKPQGPAAAATTPRGGGGRGSGKDSSSFVCSAGRAATLWAGASLAVRLTARAMSTLAWPTPHSHTWARARSALRWRERAL